MKIMDPVDTVKPLDFSSCKSFCTLMYLAFMSFSLPLEAQSNQAIDEDLSQKIILAVGQGYEKEASNILMRYFPKDSFLVEADLDLQSFPNKLPYLTDNAYLQAIAEQPFRVISRYVESANISIYLSSQIPQQAENQISSLLRKGLYLKENDQILFAQLALEYQKVDPRSEDEIRRLKSSLQETQNRILELQGRVQNSQRAISDLTRERNDAKVEALTLKNDIEKQLIRNSQLEIQIDNHKRTIDELVAKGPERENEGAQTLQQVLEHPYVQIFALIIVAFAFAVIFVLFWGFKKFSQSHGSVASGIASLGQALSSVAQLSAPQEKPEESPQHSLVQTKSISDPASTAALQSRVVELHSEIMQLLDENKYAALVSHIASLLQKDETVEIGVASMELLGTKIANQIFLSFGDKLQRKIRSFLAEGSYREGKVLALYRAGEVLMTILTMEQISTNFEGRDPQLANLISQLEIEDLCKLVTDFDEDLVARLFLYLDSKSTGEIVSYHEKANPEIVQKYINAIANLAEAAKKADLDEDLKHRVEKALNNIKKDDHRAYLAVYASLATRLSDEASASLSSTLEEKSPYVARYLEYEVLNVNTFYRLTEDVRQEICSYLTNKHIAAITLHTDADKTEHWTELLSERRKEAIGEQRILLAEQSDIKIKAECDEAKKVLNKRLIELKNNGQLTFSRDQAMDRGNGQSVKSSIMDKGA